MNEATKAEVRRRARNRCEYCGLEQRRRPLSRLHIEHIRARKHGGTNDLGNLCLACAECNQHKGSNLTGIDPDTDAVTELYHPRRQRWADHFDWSDDFIVGISATGRATVQVLDLNSPTQLRLRSTHL